MKILKLHYIEKSLYPCISFEKSDNLLDSRDFVDSQLKTTEDADQIVHLPFENQTNVQRIRGWRIEKLQKSWGPNTKI